MSISILQIGKKPKAMVGPNVRWNKWCSNPNSANSSGADCSIANGVNSDPVPTEPAKLVEGVVVTGRDTFVPANARVSWQWKEALERLSDRAGEIGALIDRLAGEL